MSGNRPFQGERDPAHGTLKSIRLYDNGTRRKGCPISTSSDPITVARLKPEARRMRTNQSVDMVIYFGIMRQKNGQYLK